jgi:hypothetical protein
MNRLQLQAIVSLPEAPPPALRDVATPEATVLAVYDSISGPPEIEQERNWDRLRSLFAPRAAFRLVRWPGPDGTDDVLREWSVEEFVDAGKSAWRDAGFWEREIWSRTVRYGNIAHVLSTSQPTEPTTAPERDRRSGRAGNRPKSGRCVPRASETGTATVAVAAP